MKMTEPYSPTARAKASVKPVKQRGNDTRQHDAAHRHPAPGAERSGGFLQFLVEIFEHRLHRAHDERQADEDQRDKDAERREGDPDAERRQQAADPAGFGVERRQRDAGDRGRQRKRNVDDGIKQAAARKAVAHQRPDDDRAEHQIGRRRRERQSERKREGVQRAAAGDDGDELVEAELGGLEEQRRERDQHDQRQATAASFRA